MTRPDYCSCGGPKCNCAGMRCSCRTVTDRYREIIRHDTDPQSTTWQRPDGTWHSDSDEWTRPEQPTRTAVRAGQLIQVPVHQDGCDLNNLRHDGHALDCAIRDPLAHKLTCPMSDWRWAFADTSQRTRLAEEYASRYRRHERRQLDALTQLQVDQPQPHARAICPVCEQRTDQLRQELRYRLTRSVGARRAEIRNQIVDLQDRALTTFDDLDAHGGICGVCFDETLIRS